MHSRARLSEMAGTSPAMTNQERWWLYPVETRGSRASESRDTFGGCGAPRSMKMGTINNSDVIIVGAGPAGLAAAASMGALRLEATVLEKANAVRPVWRRHYDRLHLPPDRGHSGLPGMAMPR